MQPQLGGPCHSPGEKAARRGSSTMTARLISFSLESLKRSTVSTTSLYLHGQRASNRVS